MTLFYGARGPELADYASFVRRHRLLLILGVIAGVACGLLYQHTQPQRYKSVVSVALAPFPTHMALDATSKSAEYVTIDTDAQLAKSSGVLEPVAKAMREPVSQVRGDLLVTASPLSSVLHLAVFAPTPPQAQVGARTAAHSLLHARLLLARSSLAAQAKSVPASINVLGRNLLGAHTSIDALKSAALSAQIGVLRDRLRELQLVQRSAGHVIAAAEPPQGGAGVPSKVAVGSGALFGLLGGVAVANAREQRRRRVVLQQRLAQWETTGRAFSAGA